jgi:hypothetical protein
MGLWMVLGLVVVYPAYGTPVYYSGTGHYYDLIYPDGGLAWEDARSDAEAHSYLGNQGHLVTITSPGENDFLEGLVPQIERSFWIGGYQPVHSDRGAGWIWVTGETWEYTNWWSEDNEFADAGYDWVAQFNAFGIDHGQWEDNDDYWQLPYIVEYVPEPATLSLLIFGGLAMLRRRK